VESLTCFSRQYADLKPLLKKGAVLGFLVKGDLLEGVFDPYDLGGYVLEIPEDKADEFLSFYPSCKGRPNVRVGQWDLASVALTEGMLGFIEREFGVVSLYRP